MTTSLESELRTRFADAIRTLSKPPILVGPSWLCPDGSARPGTFRFVGIPKIAKAIKRPPKVVHDLLLKRLKLEELGLVSELSDQMFLRIFPKTAETAPVAGASGNRAGQE